MVAPNPSLKKKGNTTANVEKGVGILHLDLTP